MYNISAIQTLTCPGVKSMLWKDENGDPFILTKYMEVYAYSDSILGCYCWHRKIRLQLQKLGLIFDVRETDDSVCFFKTDRRNLPLILSLGAFKRRPRVQGRWIKSKEKLLGHRILPYSPIQIERKAT